MTWRRIAPWVIGVIALVAIFIDLPRTTLGMDWLPTQVAGVEFRTVLGLDLEGGSQVTLKAEPESTEPITPADMETARTIIERRVAGIGVTEPQVRTETGRRRIAADRRRGAGRRQSRPGPPPRRLDRPARVHRPAGPDADRGPGHHRRCSTRERSACSSTAARSTSPASRPRSTATSSASSSRSATTASETWCNFTTANTGRPGPIALDGEVITVPNIQNAICGGQTIITVGPQTPENEVERTELYNTLRFGALPISLIEQGVQTVDPTLGADFLAQALIAGAVGLTLVLIFMIAYYRLPGVLAAIALVFYTLVVYAVFRLIGVTLTLAGVAAFILSIGMAVDANILIFERMKEEIRAGKTLGPAIEAGFNRAWSSILDSNVASLLVASWLYWQGTTVVRGFALVLIIGVLVSMFSAVTVTRTMLRRVIRTGWGRNIELYHVER